MPFSRAEAVAKSEDGKFHSCMLGFFALNKASLVGAVKSVNDEFSAGSIDKLPFPLRVDMPFEQMAMLQGNIVSLILFQ